ncbi:unnamed protein product [Bemisia tabaci]|uniref:Uncharacterized protein n=1 Tax=Bemisia tabaci TaxID=7038 RepID=A0A9P0CAV3_BEMTA|nr:unnamed protein product [Bemisia tabaci]
MNLRGLSSLNAGLIIVAILLRSARCEGDGVEGDEGIGTEDYSVTGYEPGTAGPATEFYVAETSETTTTTVSTSGPSASDSESGETATVSYRDAMSINYYPSRRERPPKENEEASLKGPEASPGKPTKYHYYPHNQHIYLLPECAVQQVCNAVYIRLNYTQPLCACPSRYREPCSASLDTDDLHTTELSVDPRGKVLTLIKTCEPVAEMRPCRPPRDWSLLALQNVRTGKSHYLVICRCLSASVLEGPMSHDQPTYASVPGIRVYGMMCVSKQEGVKSSSTTPSSARRARPLRFRRSSFLSEKPDMPWNEIRQFLQSVEKN